MRTAPVSLFLMLAACGSDMRSSEDRSSSAPDVDGGVRAHDGGSSTTTAVADADADADAWVPPSDGIPQGLAPCDEAPYHSDFAFVEDKIFAVSCLNGCHNGATPAAGMSLVAGLAYASLVNVPSQHEGWVRVMPGDSPASMLMVQVGGEPGPELEGFMPWGQPRLCDELVDAMRRWIASGAPR